MADPRGVGLEVLGVPDFMSADRTVDKLLIHFLRPRNGGGEVRRVLYPTHIPGQALVLYEEPDGAARVLQHRRHELQVGDQKFPLQVKPADRPELDLPVEAILNVSQISDRTALKRLLHLHGLEVVEKDRRRVRVRGSMMALRSFKAETEKLLTSQRTADPTRPSSPSSSSSPPSAASKTSTHSGSAPPKPKPMRAVDPPAYSSLVPAYSPSSSWSAVGPADSRSPPPRKSSFESFITGSDVLDYAQRCKDNGIEDILARHGVEMKVVAMDTDLSSVAVTGRDALGAAEKLRLLLNDLSGTLHSRKVPLKDLDHDAQVGVAKRIQELKRSYPSVLITQMGGAIRLIGPRSPCEQLKERLLQERPAEGRTGRSQEKAPRRRSRSVPRNPSGRRGELAGEARAPLAPLAPLDGVFSSPRVGDGALTREVRGQRGRSGSLPRASAKPEEAARYGSPERTNTRRSPAVKTSLLPQRITKLFTGK